MQSIAVNDDMNGNRRICELAAVLELADKHVSEACALKRRVGSTPTCGT